MFELQPSDGDLFWNSPKTFVQPMFRLNQSTSLNSSLASSPASINGGGGLEVVPCKPSTSTPPRYSMGSAATSTSSDSPKELSKNQCPTECAVCGDKPTGYHYEVPSCNGCKTFFRRAILAEREFICKKDGKCMEKENLEHVDLSGGKRVLCPGCRFEKCVSAGMNPLAMHLPNAPQDNRIVRKILGKRGYVKPEIEQYDDEDMKPQRPLIVLEDSLSRLIDGLKYLDIKVEKFRNSTYNPNPFTVPVLDQLVAERSLISIADKLEPLQRIPADDLRLMEIDLEMNGPPGHHETRYAPGGREIVRAQKSWFSFDLLCSVEYAKTFPFLHQLNHYEKVLLLRRVTTQCMSLAQAYYSFEQNCDTVIHPDGTKPPLRHKQDHHDGSNSILKGLFNKEFFKQVVEVLARNKMDKTEYLLLKAMSLANPHVPGLSESSQQLLTKERQKYAAALFSYCIATHGPINGPPQYASILNFIDLLERRAKRMRDSHVVVVMHHEMRKRPSIPFIDDCMKD